VVRSYKKIARKRRRKSTKESRGKKKIQDPEMGERRNSHAAY